MTARQRRIYLTCFVFHFLLILLAATQDLVSILSEGENIFSPAFVRVWRQADIITSTALGNRLPDANPVRQVLTAYLHDAGIESGYGFFAPNVPNSYKLVFEVRYRDGRIEYELPEVAGSAAGIRVVALLDNIESMRYELLRRTTLKMLAFAVWREHSDATAIRAVFGRVTLPPIEGFLQGKQETYEFTSAYEFSFPSPGERQKTP